jgi:uncharacterized membrane protein (GlpM family)
MIDAKFALIPIAIALVSVVGVWKGPRAAGIAASLPVVAGPILLILALQMGPEFARAAAISAIASIGASETYNIIYSRLCARAKWHTALAAGVIGWLVVALFVANLPQTLMVSIAVASVTVCLSSFLQPRRTAAPPRQLFDWNTFIARMSLGGVLAAVVSGCAVGLGSIWSGLLSVFPILGIVMTVSVHCQEGAERVKDVCRGMIIGRFSFMAFCAYVSARLAEGGIYQTFVEATGATLVIHFIGQHLLSRTRHWRRT